MEWLDSTAHRGGWHWLSEINKSELGSQLTNLSVGLVLYDEADFLSVVLSRRKLSHKDGDWHIDYVLTITRVAILKVTKLVEADGS